MMKKQFVVGIHYLTKKGNLGSKSYRIEADSHDEALEIGRKKADKKGRSKFSGDCIEVARPKALFTVQATLIAEDEDLLHIDDHANLEEILQPFDVEANNPEEALDIYHCNIPVKVLEHFEFEAHLATLDD